MRYDDRFLDELKTRLRLSDVIGKTVKLRRQGREFVGLSPFNKEKSPSFFVNDDKGFYHDFSSGKHGDLISFLQETERLTFVEAVERLAGEAGMVLPAPDPEAAGRDRQRQGIADWLETAAAWFEAELRRPAGAEARAYLNRRGLPESEWATFRIGFAAAGRASLKDYLIAKGALSGDLAAAGLLIVPEDGGAAYDRFRDRILFPIADAKGRIISFGGRAMDPKARAKYLNGPDTELFDKGRTLYGYAGARRLLQTGGEGAALVVVEGYMDVIACQRAGIAAVAAMGTSLTEAQIELLWRAHPEPTLCFDGDAAGMRAASRAIDRALPMVAASRSFKFAVLTGGKDPDDILRDQGPDALRSQLAQTTPFVDALFTRERDSSPLDTPEQRAGLKQRLRAAAKTIADGDVASAYRDALMLRLDALFAAPARSTSRAARPDPGRGGRGARGGWRLPEIATPALPDSKDAARRLARGIEPVAAALALLALRDPGVVDDHLEALQVHGFGDPALDDLAKEIIRVRIEDARLDTVALRSHLQSSGFTALVSDIDKAALNAGAPFLEEDVAPAMARTQWSCAFEILSRLAALDEALALAKLDWVGGVGGDAFQSLKKERDSLRRAIGSRRIWTSEAGI